MRKGRTARDIPPPLELQCLAAHKPLAYTTVMTMLDRLARKQMVSRRKVGRSFVYTPLISREQVRRLAVRELVDSLFDGSAETLQAYLKGSPPATVPAFVREDEPAALDAALL